MSSIPPTYYPPSTVLPIFNPDSFTDGTVVSGYTTAQTADLTAKIAENNLLIRQITAKLTDLGTIIYSASIPNTTIPINTLTNLYSAAYSPGVYLCTYSFYFAQPVDDPTYYWIGGVVAIPNSQLGSGQPYNISFQPFKSSKQYNGSFNGSCYIYLTTTQTIDINIKISGPTSPTGLNTWVTGSTGTTYPTYLPYTPVNLQIVKILSL